MQGRCCRFRIIAVCGMHNGGLNVGNDSLGIRLSDRNRPLTRRNDRVHGFLKMESQRDSNGQLMYCAAKSCRYRQGRPPFKLFIELIEKRVRPSDANRLQERISLHL